MAETGPTRRQRSESRRQNYKVSTSARILKNGEDVRGMADDEGKLWVYAVVFRKVCEAARFAVGEGGWAAVGSSFIRGSESRRR